MTEASQYLSSVEQIMRTQPLSVFADDSIAVVKKVFDATDGEPVPVVDATDTLIGVITASDLLVDGLSTARQLATHSRMTVAPHESAFSVASRMLRRRVDWVPVVKNRKLVGTITRNCILSAFGEMHAV